MISSFSRHQVLGVNLIVFFFSLFFPSLTQLRKDFPSCQHPGSEDNTSNLVIPKCVQNLSTPPPLLPLFPPVKDKCLVGFWWFLVHLAINLHSIFITHTYKLSQVQLYILSSPGTCHLTQAGKRWLPGEGQKGKDAPSSQAPDACIIIIVIIISWRGQGWGGGVLVFSRPPAGQRRDGAGW